MSTGLFSIARSAIMTHQTALQTISQNIANAETPGYSRQEAQLMANTPVRLAYGNVGTGVHVETIIRKRDILLDETFRSAAGQSGEMNCAAVCWGSSKASLASRPMPACPTRSISSGARGAIWPRRRAAGAAQAPSCSQRGSSR